ncbi:signal peptidase I [Microbulbifer sp. SAOS-129_SWC]|uniref:signal peptidase I n=1 Tax=Microbulbifer sp. SAOS-129_SWC TaxID=3145235 RepID=UPI003216CABD
MKRSPLLFFAAAAVIALAVYIINPYGTASLDPRARIWGITFFSMPSRSMQPTLNPGDLIVVETFAYRSSEPAPGDIVVYRAPHSDNAFVGRVVAQGGDRIAFADSVVTRNGERRDERYILPGKTLCRLANFPEIAVPDGRLFIAGDNRCNSLDSRMFGTVSRDKLIGKVVYVLGGTEETPG